MFMKPNREARTRTLGDIINEKMTEKKTEIQSQFSDGTELIKVTKNILTVYFKTNVQHCCSFEQSKEQYCQLFPRTSTQT